MKFAFVPAIGVSALLILPLCGADSTAARATIQPAAERHRTPDFLLKDSTGHNAKLKNYRGKILVLDFWATWCHGCKEEIPYFTDFQRNYGKKGLAVVGVSLDDDGWRVLNPFLAGTNVGYRIVLGNDATAKRFGIEYMPDTFLIDRKGRIAAVYNGIVDRNDIDANIRKLLAE